MSEPEERFSGLDPAFDGETSVYGFDFCCFLFFTRILIDVLFVFAFKRYVDINVFATSWTMSFMSSGFSIYFVLAFSFSVSLLLVLLFFPF